MDVNRGRSRIVWTVGGTVWLAGCLLWLLTGPPVTADDGNWTVPPASPVLQNPRFECDDGFVDGFNPVGKDVRIPRGWTEVYVDGAAQVLSTRLSVWEGVCNHVDDSSHFVERAYGGLYDSVYIRSQDIETPPEPGKPFDMVLYQKVPATVGGTYSLSAWMVSLCRNYQDTNVCPPGEYIVKEVGLDPLGGSDPDGKSVERMKNSVNYVDDQGERIGWQNITVGTRALTDTLTVFLRMTAPYDQRGNSGFMDEVSLVRGPFARFKTLPESVVGSAPLAIAWEGLQSPDVTAMAGQKYELYYSVQVRPEGGEWRDLAVETTQTSQDFVPRCVNTTYEFRVRAGTEQPEGSGGVAPDHSYPGAWSLPVSVYFAPPAVISSTPVTPTGSERLFLPVARRHVEC